MGCHPVQSVKTAHNQAKSFETVNDFLQTVDAARFSVVHGGKVVSAT